MEQFCDELLSVQNHKPPVSANKINGLAKLAIKLFKQHYKNVVNEVEKFIKKSRPEHRLTALYIIDAIVRGSIRQFGPKDLYASRFATNLERSLDYIFQCPAKDQRAVRRVIALWHKNQVFSPTVIDTLVMVSIRRTGTPPDLPETDAEASDTPVADNEGKSPSPPSLSPSPPGDQPSTAAATTTYVHHLHEKTPSSGSGLLSPFGVALPSDPRLATAAAGAGGAPPPPPPLQSPTDPRVRQSAVALGEPGAFVSAAAAAASPVGETPNVSGSHLLAMLGAHVAGLFPLAPSGVGALTSPTPQQQLVAPLATTASTTTPLPPARAPPGSASLMQPPPLTDPRLLLPGSHHQQQQQQQLHVVAPSVPVAAAWPTSDINQSPRGAEVVPPSPTVPAGTVSSGKQQSYDHPLYFDYGDDDDDDTRIEEQRKLRQEQEERLLAAQNERPEDPPQPQPAQAPMQSLQWPAGSMPPQHAGAPAPSARQTPEQLVAALAAFYGAEPSGPASRGSPIDSSSAVTNINMISGAPSDASLPPTSSSSSSSSSVYDPFMPSSFSAPPPLPLPSSSSSSSSSTRAELTGFTKVATTTCYLGGLPPGCTHDVLRNHFSAYGKIARLKVMDDKNVAFVTFARRADAEGLKAQGDAGQVVLSGHSLKVGWARGANPIGAKENFNMETGETLVTVEEAMRYQQANPGHSSSSSSSSSAPSDHRHGLSAGHDGRGRGERGGGGEGRGGEGSGPSFSSAYPQALSAPPYSAFPSAFEPQNHHPHLHHPPPPPPSPHFQQQQQQQHYHPVGSPPPELARGGRGGGGGGDGSSGGGYPTAAAGGVGGGGVHHQPFLSRTNGGEETARPFVGAPPPMGSSSSSSSHTYGPAFVPRASEHPGDYHHHHYHHHQAAGPGHPPPPPHGGGERERGGGGGRGGGYAMAPRDDGGGSLKRRRDDEASGRRADGGDERDRPRKQWRDDYHRQNGDDDNHRRSGGGGSSSKDSSTSSSYRPRLRKESSGWDKTSS